MEKRHIAKLLLIETVMIAAITFVLGIAVGIGLEQLITGLLANLLGEHASKLSAHISMTGILDSVAVMAVTFVGVFLFALRTLHFSNPIELLSAA
jgi:putative ABC transport system permease protein